MNTHEDDTKEKRVGDYIFRKAVASSNESPTAKGELPQDPAAEEIARLLAQLPDKKKLDAWAKDLEDHVRRSGARGLGNTTEMFTKLVSERTELARLHLETREHDAVSGSEATIHNTIRILNVCLRMMDTREKLLYWLEKKGAHKNSIKHIRRTTATVLPEWATLKVESEAYPDGSYSFYSILNFLMGKIEENEVVFTDRDYKLFSDCICKVFEDTKGAEFAFLFGMLFLMTSEIFNHYYKSKLSYSRDNLCTKHTYDLVNTFVSKTFAAITYEEDPCHADARNFLDTFLNHSPLGGNRNDNIGSLLMALTNRRLFGEIEEATFIKNLQDVYDVTDDPWYQDLAEDITARYAEYTPHFIIMTNALSSFFFTEKQWSSSDVENIRRLCEELQISTQWKRIEKLIQAPLAKQTEYVGSRMRLEDDLLFAQVFFVFDEEKIERNEISGDPAYGLTTLAVDLSPEHIAIYLHLIDQEMIDESLQANMLHLILALLENIKNAQLALKHISQQGEVVYLRPQDVAPARTKGVSKTPRGPHKRQKTVETEVELSNHMSSGFSHEIQQQRTRPVFTMTESMKQSLTGRFHAADLERIQEKLMQANRGAGIVKPYPNFPGPIPGKTVWAIRLNRQIRILAQEGIKKGTAQVFDVKYKSGIERK